MKFDRILFFSFIAGLLFLITGILSLKHYSVNWDEPVHFGRGHAILHYFLTGETNYQRLSAEKNVRRSYYQNVEYTVDFFENNFQKGGAYVVGGGHPPLSDVLAAVFNSIFYQQLNILPDIEAFHLYGVVLASILVSFVFYYTSKYYGYYAGIISFLSLSLYPLFLSESRFNIKDIPEAVFYSLTILFFFNGIVGKSIKWIMLSAFIFGLGFATKLNIVFIPLVLIPWLFIYYFPEIKKNSIKLVIKNKLRFFASLLFYPVFGLVLFLATWPLLWKDTFTRMAQVIGYYKQIGINPNFDSRYLTIQNINTYPTQWILYTTLPIVILLTIAGIVSVIVYGRKEMNKFSVLVLLWFLVPIIRVSAPNAGIYGGVRQIMEYIPATAILSGLGAKYIVELTYRLVIYYIKRHKHNISLKIKNLILSKVKFISLHFAIQLFIVALFIPSVVKIISLYPNESLYFNVFIGGLTGAAENEIPGWGNTLGSTYRQGTVWLNEHAEKNAKLALVYELASNIPPMDLRPDIFFYNHVRSAYKQEGEYLIGVTHQGTNRRGYHRKYLDTFLNPVYELKADGVAVLKIWKNSKEYLKDEFKNKNIREIDSSYKKVNDTIVADVGKNVRLVRIEMKSSSIDCQKPKNGYFEISTNDIEWERLPGDFVFFPLASWFSTQPRDGTLAFLFAGDYARYIRIVVNDEKSCLLKSDPDIRVWAI